MGLRADAVGADSSRTRPRDGTDKSRHTVAVDRSFPRSAPVAVDSCGRPDVIMKRTFDVVAAGVGLALLSPVLALVALVLRFTHGRPVLFRQVRMGRDERPFALVKFRTMSDVRDDDGELLPDAERVHGVGRFLRRTSVDELPELWNVVRGNMSIVGPRPLPEAYRGRFSPWERRRHEVRPGITGWAQVNGRNELDWNERLAADVWYVDNRSFGLDLRIILRTVRVVLGARGISAPGAATMAELAPSVDRRTA